MDTALEFIALLTCGDWEKLWNEGKNRSRFMPLTLKIAIVLLCFALCGAGTFMASTAREESKQPQKMNAIPVKNHDLARRIWIQV
jgi:flagellar basal body-associated protein FliL